MAGKTKYLLNRDGRYFARIVIPKHLRAFLDNKTELRTPLGPDRRSALAQLEMAVADMKRELAVAERRAKVASGKAITPGRYPLSPDEIAVRDYNSRMAFDIELRNAGPGWVSVGIDDLRVKLLRDGLAGRLNDDTLETLIGARVERYRLLGNTTATRGMDDWRQVARALCMSELESLARVAERDEGDFTGKPENPVLLLAECAYSASQGDGRSPFLHDMLEPFFARRRRHSARLETKIQP